MANKTDLILCMKWQVYKKCHNLVIVKNIHTDKTIKSIFSYLIFANKCLHQKSNATILIYGFVQMNDNL